MNLNIIIKCILRIEESPSRRTSLERSYCPHSQSDRASWIERARESGEWGLEWDGFVFEAIWRLTSSWPDNGSSNGKFINSSSDLPIESLWGNRNVIAGLITLLASRSGGWLLTAAATGSSSTAAVICKFHSSSSHYKVNVKVHPRQTIYSHFTGTTLGGFHLQEINQLQRDKQGLVCSVQQHRLYAQVTSLAAASRGGAWLLIAAATWRWSAAA